MAFSSRNGDRSGLRSTIRLMMWGVSGNADASSIAQLRALVEPLVLRRLGDGARVTRHG